MKFSRRNFLLSSLKGSVTIAAASLLSPLLGCEKGCGPRQKNDTGANNIDAKVLEPEELTEQEKSIRASLIYVDQSVVPGRFCDNCKLYTNPINNNPMGGCKIVPGPIHPKGHCTAWIPLM